MIPLLHFFLFYYHILALEYHFLLNVKHGASKGKQMGMKKS